MKIKILLIEYFSEINLDFSIGVVSLATILKESHYDCEIINIDYFLKKEKPTNNNNIASYIANILLSQKPKIIGFSCMCNNYHIFIKAAMIIKEINPEIKIFFGGPQASLTAYNTMQNFECIDAICVGESEDTIVDTIKFLIGQIKNAPKNLHYRTENGDILNTDIQLAYNNDLDALPLLNYTLIPFFDEIKDVNIEVGRGCPFSCVFCSTKTFWAQRTRYKSIERILLEIENLVENYNKTSFIFVHDLFTAKRSFIENFCKELILRNFNITWRCSSRIDTIDSELIKLMAEAGCKSIFFGVESGSAKIQKQINKNLQLYKIDNLFLELNKHQLYDSAFSFIYGFPQETEEDLKETLNIIQKIIINHNFRVILNKCIVLPGTQLLIDYYDQIKPQNSFSNIFGQAVDDQSYYSIVANNKDIFPYFFSFDTNYHNKYANLESFFTVYIMIKTFYRGVFKLLNEIYNQNLLQMFLLCNSIMKNDIIEISNSSQLFNYMSFSNNSMNVIMDLKSFLIKFSEILKSKEIRVFMQELINFEFRIRTMEDNKINQAIFKNDVVTYLNTSAIFEKCSKITNQLIINKANGKIQIRREILKGD